MVIGRQAHDLRHNIQDTPQGRLVTSELRYTMASWP
jgi:hypothetical protein